MKHAQEWTQKVAEAEWLAIQKSIPQIKDRLSEDTKKAISMTNDKRVQGALAQIDLLFEEDDQINLPMKEQ